MLSEEFFTSFRGQPKSSNTAVAKDVGIHLHTLHPLHGIKATFKKSSTPSNGLAMSSTHIFAAQLDKAVVHVYSRERANQEALISFPERVSSLIMLSDSVLVLGTAEGRLILWEILTGRQVSTPASHLQAVSCLTASRTHVISASEDSNIHVWSTASLLSLATTGTLEPLRSLSNHRAAVTSLAMGHSSTKTNICVSASRDNTCIIWNYDTGDLLRTFLLPATPLCLTLDPCDRAVYIGYEDGTVQPLDFFEPSSSVNPLFDSKLQSTPTQVVTPLWTAPSDVGATHCLALCYDGTSLLSGHASGRLIQWDTGRRSFSGELIDLNATVNNIIMVPPFAPQLLTKAGSVVKPRLGEGHYTFTAQFTGDLEPDEFQKAMLSSGVPSNLLEAAIAEFSRPVMATGGGDEQLRKENEDLWAIINEQRALQKRTLDKYSKIKGVQN